VALCPSPAVPTGTGQLVMIRDTDAAAAAAAAATPGTGAGAGAAAPAVGAQHVSAFRGVALKVCGESGNAFDLASGCLGVADEMVPHHH